ncbi:MAG: hypothetical protein KGM49_01980 [Sphingomonadales bacterium]|nr:hypothetical protein [Sphingomonadales bacterium]
MAQTDQSPDDRVAEVLARAHDTYGAVEPRKTCNGGSDDEIVVCAQTDSSKYRVPSTIDSDPGSRAALRTGMPSPPQLDRGSCKGQPGCVTGGWAPPPIYYINLKALPEAPEGSEADQVAKGEKASR